MAVDEALLDACAASQGWVAPTLRLYAWSPAALSLGRLQPALHDADYLAADGLDLVRRPTGGGAVLHDRERTYALVGRLRQPPFPGGVLATYERIAEALVAALRALGVDARAAGSGTERGRMRPRPAALCFAEVSRYEIAHGTTKLVGSAQLRRRGAFLQHGSIVLRDDPVRAARATGAAPLPTARVTGLEPLLARSVTPLELDEALVSAFTRVLGLPLRSGGLSDDEQRRALSLTQSKYRSEAWTLHGLSAAARPAPCARPSPASSPSPYGCERPREAQARATPPRSE
jgi:lipoate-protein ligase A